MYPRLIYVSRFSAHTKSLTTGKALMKVIGRSIQPHYSIGWFLRGSRLSVATPLITALYANDPLMFLLDY